MTLSLVSTITRDQISLITTSSSSYKSIFRGTDYVVITRKSLGRVLRHRRRTALFFIKAVKFQLLKFPRLIIAVKQGFIQYKVQCIENQVRNETQILRQSIYPFQGHVVKPFSSVYGYFRFHDLLTTIQRAVHIYYFT